MMKELVDCPHCRARLTVSEARRGNRATPKHGRKVDRMANTKTTKVRSAKGRKATGKPTNAATATNGRRQGRPRGGGFAWTQERMVRLAKIAKNAETKPELLEALHSAPEFEGAQISESVVSVQLSRLRANGVDIPRFKRSGSTVDFAAIAEAV